LNSDDTLRRGDTDVDDPWIMTVKGPSGSHSSSSLDSLSSTSSTSSFSAMMGPNNNASSQPNSFSLNSNEDEDEDQSDEIPHQLPDDDGEIVDEDTLDSRRPRNAEYVKEDEVMISSHQNKSSPQHRVVVSSSSSNASTEDYSSQNAFAKFHKLDQQHQQQQHSNYQRNQSVSPPSTMVAPAPVFKNQIHVQSSPINQMPAQTNHHHRGGDHHHGENNNFSHANPNKVRESPERTKHGGSGGRGDHSKPSSSSSSSSSHHHQHHSKNHANSSSSNSSNGVVMSVLTPVLLEV
jgi:hypothetical protein